jgi:ketosteroid isomerase-like protein
MFDPNDPMTTIRAYVDGFNNGDVEAMAAACADPMQILDGLAPHVWQGPTAAQDWYAAALAEAKHAGGSDLHIGTGEPKHVDVAGDFAYVALPVTFEYNLPGKHVNQTDAWWTFSLRNLDGAWTLSAWSWTKGDFTVT